MINIKHNLIRKIELSLLFIVYLVLILNVIIFKDNPIAAFSAFFGITYTYLAGIGRPNCYLFGLSGSGLYSWLSFSNALWGNLALYLFYYVPMQIAGFFKWKHNLKQDKNEIIKIRLSNKERGIIFLISAICTFAFIIFLKTINDTNPIFDGITTIFSIIGMYLTVKRAIEQWIVWIIVNGLSALMWFEIAANGEKVYSTVIMWIVYFFLAIYFYITWKKELNQQNL